MKEKNLPDDINSKSLDELTQEANNIIEQLEKKDDLKTSLELITNLPKNGSDLIEIGMPFSDPMADGPTIQLSSNRAIANGINLTNIFDICKKFREKI